MTARKSNLDVSPLANVSHELRSPLMVVKSALDLLSQDKKSKLSNKANHLIEISKRNTNYMIDVLTKLIDVYKIESGKITPNKNKIFISKIIDSIISRLKISIRVKKIILEKEISKRIPAIFADKLLLEQALTNILENAIKFTPENGKIYIKTCRNKNFIEISISDTGIGILSQHIEKIFDKFYKVRDKHTSLYYTGAGLGLAITKQIVQLHNGKISVESKFRKGTKFTISLPID